VSLARRRAASGVGTYLGPRAFYKKDMARKAKADQRTPLPPRCAHCRLPGRIRLDAPDKDGVIVGVPHCENHTIDCDGTCGLEERRKQDGEE